MTFPYSINHFKEHTKELHQILDIEKIIAFTGLKKEHELLEYLLVIRQEFFSALDQIKLSIQAKNRDQFKKQAHSLKGLSNATGYVPLMNMMAYADTHALQMDWDEALSIWGNAFLCFYSLRDKIDEFIRGQQLYTEMPLQSIHCLAVVQQNTTRNILAILLSKMGCTVVLHAAGETEAVDILHQNHIDMVLAEFALPSGSGISLLQRIRSNHTQARHDLPVAFITGKSDQLHFRDAMRLSANGFTGRQVTLTILAALLLRLYDYHHITPCWLLPPSGYLPSENPHPTSIIHDRETEDSLSTNESTFVENLYYIKPGSVLAEDLTDHQNRIIYKQGHVLTPLELDHFKDLLQFDSPYHNLHIMQNNY